MTRHKARLSPAWALPCALLAALLSGCVGGQGYLAGFQRVELGEQASAYPGSYARTIGPPKVWEEVPSDPGPCDVCGRPSDCIKQRKTLTQKGKLRMEFCSEHCAYKFYSSPFWRWRVGG